MYPFNRAASVNVESRENEPNRPVFIRQKNFLENILEMSLMSNGTINSNALSAKEEQPFIEENVNSLSDSTMQRTPSVLPFRNVRSISRSLTPVFHFLRMVAFFPGIFQKSDRKSRRTTFVKYFFLYNFSLAVIFLNCYIFKGNLWLMQFYRHKFGLMNASTISSIVSGVKPLVNVVHLSIFILNIKAHYRLIHMVDTVDLCFRASFHATPNALYYSLILFLFSFIFFSVPLTLLAVEFVSFGQQQNGSLAFAGFGSLSDTYFIIVPMLSLWNVVPLFYYDMYNRIVRFYCRILIKSLDREHTKRFFSLKFYYEQFLRITYVQDAVSDLFNPFILFSLAWSMAILCLTIYFLTQPTSSLTEPIDPRDIANTTLRNLLNKKVAFSICWSTIQVLVATLNILIICATGTQTNETTRQIINHVLRIVPDINADLDRFQISCFVHKMSTQHMWGMTVWRAFPLQRTTFFTLVSVIITYSFLLLRLKDNQSISSIKTIVYANSTS